MPTVHLDALRGVFDVLDRRLGLTVTDLGRDTASDATVVSARPKRDTKAVRAEVRQGLPQPIGDKKKYTDEQRRVVKISE